MLTRHVTSGGAASLAEPLHWVTLVTRLGDVLVNVPSPPGHGPGEQRRFTVVVEPLVAPLIVFTIVTSQLNPVVAPAGVALRPLHWSMTMVAALAKDAGRTRPAIENALMPTTTAIPIARAIRKGRRGKPSAKTVLSILIKSDASGTSSPVWPL
jgi:hypothetical protein